MNNDAEDTDVTYVLICATTNIRTHLRVNFNNNNLKILKAFKTFKEFKAWISDSFS